MFRSAKLESLNMPLSSQPHIPKLQMELLNQGNEDQKDKDLGDMYNLTEESVSTFIQELLLIMVASNQETPEEIKSYRSASSKHSHGSLSARFLNHAPISRKLSHSLTDLSHDENFALPPQSPRTTFHDVTLPHHYKFLVGFYLKFLFYKA